MANMQALQWKCHAEYTTDAAASSSSLSEIRRRDVGSFATACRGRVLHGSDVEVALEEGDIQSVAVIIREAKTIDWSGCAPWSVVCRTCRPEVLRFALSQPALISLVNRGYPLRLAVIAGFHEALSALLELNEVDPNHGCPIFFAVSRGDLTAVKLLGSHPRTTINAFCPSRGTTALCQAILCGAEDVFCYLVAHPRVDINRGFLLTPLQHCVAEGRLSFAKILLSRPSLLVNKSVGASASPLWMALEAGQRDIATLLLRDARSSVTESMIDDFEENENIEALQLVADVEGAAPVGRLWRKRRIVLLSALFLQLLSCIADIGTLVAAGAAGLPMLVASLVVVHIAMSLISAVAVFRAGADKLVVSLRAVPLLPLFYFVLVLRVLRLHVTGALLRRSAAFGFAVKDISYAASKSLVVVSTALALVQSWSSVSSVAAWVIFAILSHIALLAIAGYLRLMNVSSKHAAAGYHRIV